MKMSGKIGFGVVGLATMLAFAVNAALPEGYTELDYVESYGIIDTGVVPKTTTRVVCDFRYTTVPTASARNGWTATYDGAFWFGTDNTPANFGASVSGDFKVADTGVALDTARHTFDISTAAIKFDGNNVANPGSAYTRNGDTMYLFVSRHQSEGTIGGGSSMAIYSCQIYDGDTLVRDFVPARRVSDQAVGLYDKTPGADKVFYANERIDYYAIVATQDAVGQTSIYGTQSAAGWALTQDSAAVAVRGINQEYATYHVWQNVMHRTPQNISYTTPVTSSIVVEPGVKWEIGNVLTKNTLTLNNVTLCAGASCEVVQYRVEGAYDNYIDGSFVISNGAALKIDCCSWSDSYRSFEHLAATVAGKGEIAMFNAASSGNAVPLQNFSSTITGDISGFRGDLVAYNGAMNGATLFRLTLANASSIPGDPAAGDTARVVVTNGAWLGVNYDWNSPANRIWDFGSGRRPVVFVAAGKTVTINGDILGSSGLVKAGPGTLVLTKRGSFSGACEVIDGKVRLEGGARALASLFRRKETVSLPAGYTMLENLTLAGGANNSYIDTGYTPTSGTFGFFFDYMPNVAIAANTGSRVMGSSLRNNGMWGGLIFSNWAANNTASGQFGFGGSGSVRSVNISADGGQVGYTRMRLSLMDGQVELSRGWRTYFAMREVNPANFGGSVYVGNLHCDTMAAGAPMSVYRYKIFESERLVHDFVPVQRTSDGAVGLYDTFGGLGFRPAADAQYIAAGPAYSDSDSEWLEVVPSGFLYILR